MISSLCKCIYLKKTKHVRNKSEFEEYICSSSECHTGLLTGSYVTEELMVLPVVT